MKPQRTLAPYLLLSISLFTLAGVWLFSFMFLANISTNYETFMHSCRIIHDFETCRGLWFK